MRQKILNPVPKLNEEYRPTCEHSLDTWQEDAHRHKLMDKRPSWDCGKNYKDIVANYKWTVSRGLRRETEFYGCAEKRYSH